jgi:hypothetical protein
LKKSPLSLYWDTMSLALEAQQVINMRMMLFAFGGKMAEREQRLMVDEKVRAGSKLALDSALALASGKSPESIGQKNVDHYRKIVNANRKRLSNI